MKVIYVGSMEKVAEFIFFNEQMELRGIICEADKVSDTLYTYSIVRKVPIYSVEKTSDLFSIAKQLGNEYVYIMCSYGKRIPIEKLRGYRWYNIHYAELPKYKGRHPTYWATVSNENHVGITLHEVTENFDEGEIIAQEKVRYYFWENEAVLFEKLTQCIPKLLDMLVQNNNRKIFMKNDGGNYYLPVAEKELTLNLDKDEPDVIYNKVRSQARANGARLLVDGIIFRIFNFYYSKQNFKEAYKVIGKNLYIKYRKDITIVSDDYLIEINKKIEE